MFWCHEHKNCKLPKTKLWRNELETKKKHKLFRPKIFHLNDKFKNESIFQWGLLRNLNLLNFIHRQVIVNITNPSVLRERFISRVNSIQPSTGALDSFEGSRRTILDKSLLPSSSLYVFHADAVVVVTLRRRRRRHQHKTPFFLKWDPSPLLPSWNLLQSCLFFWIVVDTFWVSGWAHSFEERERKRERDR